MNIRLLGTMIGVFLVYNLLTFYIGWNGWVWLHTTFQLENAMIYALVVLILAYGYFIGKIGPRFLFFKIIGSYWMALVQYALLIFPLANLVVWLFQFTTISQETIIFWTGIVVMTTLLFIFSLGTFNAYQPIIRTYKIQLTKQAGSFNKLRIAMASDMHFGYLSGKSHLQRLIKNVHQIQPDLILLPGDIIDDEPEPFIRKKMGDDMKQLKAPLGTFGILGNHEYYGGKIPEYLKEMESTDIKILLDDVILIKDSFYLIGRRDRTEKDRLELETLMKNVDKTLPVIMMDHQPYHLDQAEEAGVDIMLSGHTHRGQMAPNHLITKRIFELDWGYMKKHHLHTIVSSGFGFWGPPLRIGSRSEIVQIDIEFIQS
ncbi:hypothetical protein IQ10_00119 [Halalkalibacter nanhaiisediminis]|uniref:Calcineurin-like phosphoesterase domain-containing protein n=2 Tax=Halalkalibacter nanhaiisediminis TaxID=688079 RepID=A0A562QSG9_9BACI|nr:hypothetical protein IQ10_00119 [Halalkalibacter nanhaiisediminis]